MEAELAPQPETYEILSKGKNGEHGQVLIYTKARKAVKM